VAITIEKGLAVVKDRSSLLLVELIATTLCSRLKKVTELNLVSLVSPLSVETLSDLNTLAPTKTYALPMASELLSVEDKRSLALELMETVTNKTTGL
jgi:hypothetical protein